MSNNSTGGGHHAIPSAFPPLPPQSPASSSSAPPAVVKSLPLAEGQIKTEQPSLSSSRVPPPPKAPSKKGKEVNKAASELNLACRTCRKRKVRCDSARPKCATCTRRGDVCEYDAEVRRRGPDIKPRARDSSRLNGGSKASTASAAAAAAGGSLRRINLSSHPPSSGGSSTARSAAGSSSSGPRHSAAAAAATASRGSNAGLPSPSPHQSRGLASTVLTPSDGSGMPPNSPMSGGGGGPPNGNGNGGDLPGFALAPHQALHQWSQWGPTTHDGLPAGTSGAGPSHNGVSGGATGEQLLQPQMASVDPRQAYTLAARHPTEFTGWNQPLDPQGTAWYPDAAGQLGACHQPRWNQPSLPYGSFDGHHNGPNLQQQPGHSDLTSHNSSSSALSWSRGYTPVDPALLAPDTQKLFDDAAYHSRQQQYLQAVPLAPTPSPDNGKTAANSESPERLSSELHSLVGRSIGSFSVDQAQKQIELALHGLKRKRRLGLIDLLSPEDESALDTSSHSQAKYHTSWLNAPIAGPPVPCAPELPAAVHWPGPASEPWWDVLVRELSVEYAEPPSEARVLETVIDCVTRVSGHPLLGCVYAPALVWSLGVPERRAGLQPSLVYIVLALSILLANPHRSQAGRGDTGLSGRLLALQLRYSAEGHLRAAAGRVASGDKLDLDLVKTACLIAAFEIQSHPLYNFGRFEQAIHDLDGWMLRLSRDPNLGMRDFDPPDANSVPQVPIHVGEASLPRFPKDDYAPYVLPGTIGPVTLPKWPTSYEDIHRESIRRLWWTCCDLTCSLQRSRFNLRMKALELFIFRVDSYCVMFPAETIFLESPTDHVYATCNIWALACIAQLLWMFAFRLHHLHGVSQAYKDSVAVRVWDETFKIESLYGGGGLTGFDIGQLEKSLPPWQQPPASGVRADLGPLSGLLWAQRDWLALIRMLVSDTFRRNVPSSPTLSAQALARSLSVDYLREQAATARQLRIIARDVTHNSADAPVFSRLCGHGTTMTSQIIRALVIFNFDQTLYLALETIRDELLPLFFDIIRLYPSEGLCQLMRLLLPFLNDASAQASRLAGAVPDRFPQVVPDWDSVAPLTKREIEGEMERRAQAGADAQAAAAAQQ